MITDESIYPITSKSPLPGREILLGVRFADVCAHLAGGDVEAGDEGIGAVSGVLELAPFDAPGLTDKVGAMR